MLLTLTLTMTMRLVITDGDGDGDGDEGQRKVDFMFPNLNVTLDIGRILQEEKKVKPLLFSV